MTAKIAILSRSTDFSMGASEVKINWSSADEAGSTFWSAGSPSRVTVPVGISHLCFNWTANTINSNSTNDFRFDLWKNGSLFMKGHWYDNGQYSAVGHSTGAVAVSEGDYFEVSAYYTAGSTFDLMSSRTFFSCYTPGSVVGFVKAHVDTATLTATPSTVSFQTPQVDTHSTHDGTTGFDVPAGVNYAAVSMIGFFTDLSGSARAFWRVAVNGTDVGFCDGAILGKGSGMPIGVIAVSPGDTITVNGYSVITKNIALFPTYDLSYLNIQWLD